MRASICGSRMLSMMSLARCAGLGPSPAVAILGPPIAAANFGKIHSIT